MLFNVGKGHFFLDDVGSVDDTSSVRSVKDTPRTAVRTHATDKDGEETATHGEHGADTGEQTESSGVSSICSDDLSEQ